MMHIRRYDHITHSSLLFFTTVNITMNRDDSRSTSTCRHNSEQIFPPISERFAALSTLFKTFTWWKRTRVDLFPVSLESKNTFQLYLVSLWTTRVEIFVFCCLFSHQLWLSITLAWCCKDSLILPYFFHFLFRHLTSCRPFSFSLIGRLVHYFDSFHLCTLVLSTRGQNW